MNLHRSIKHKVIDINKIYNEHIIKITIIILEYSFISYSYHSLNLNDDDNNNNNVKLIYYYRCILLKRLILE